MSSVRKFLEEFLVGPDRIAWNAVKNVSENFLGNFSAPNYAQLVEKNAYEHTNSHLDSGANIGVVGDEPRRKVSRGRNK